MGNQRPLSYGTIYTGYALNNNIASVNCAGRAGVGNSENVKRVSHARK